MKRASEQFITTFGRTITTKILSDVIKRIKKGDTDSEIINETLSFLPVDEERDVDEAYEVIDYCQDLIEQEELDRYIEGL